jgi:hypothetical protein
MEVQFGHAADKGVPKRVEDFAVVDDFSLNAFAASGQRPSEGTVRASLALAAATVSGPRASRAGTIFCQPTPTLVGTILFLRASSRIGVAEASGTGLCQEALQKNVLSADV